MLKRHSRKRFIAEINVVPYIDVMLVLLVIFMITAPLLNRGVEVDLPTSAAESLPPAEQKPLILSVDRDGAYYLNLAANPRRPLTAEGVFDLARVVLNKTPELSVLVRADETVNYGVVVRAMALLQQAGAAKVGLLTAPIEP